MALAMMNAMIQNIVAEPTNTPQPLKGWSVILCVELRARMKLT